MAKIYTNAKKVLIILGLSQIILICVSLPLDYPDTQSDYFIAVFV